MVVFVLKNSREMWPSWVESLNRRFPQRSCGFPGASQSMQRMLDRMENYTLLLSTISVGLARRIVFPTVTQLLRLLA